MLVLKFKYSIPGINFMYICVSHFQKISYLCHYGKPAQRSLISLYHGQSLEGGFIWPMVLCNLILQLRRLKIWQRSLLSPIELIAKLKSIFIVNQWKMFKNDKIMSSKWLFIGKVNLPVVKKMCSKESKFQTDSSFLFKKVTNWYIMKNNIYLKIYFIL